PTISDTPPTDSTTLSLHDALPIYEPDSAEEASRRDRDDEHDERVEVERCSHREWLNDVLKQAVREDDDDEHRNRDRRSLRAEGEDRKSTRLNSSHLVISYAVFCLK